jgi:hypothetical protein
MESVGIMDSAHPQDRAEKEKRPEREIKGG